MYGAGRLQRVVVDTNVLVSAVIRPQGRVGALITHLRDGNYIPIYSAAMLDELGSDAR
jgi:predicted nucleic acid-binding protein